MTFFECYPDESLLKYLAFNAKALSGGHSFGRSNVARKLNHTTNSLALVDEDPNSAKDSYLKYLFSLKPHYNDKYLLCFKDPRKGNILVVVRPNLEAWAIKLAQEKRIDLGSKKYALSMNESVLHNLLTPKANISQRTKFTDFMKDISDHPSIINLKKLVKI